MGQEKRTIAQNRKARHDYFVDEVYEAGIVLTGTEVKSLRQGRVNLKDSYVTIKDGELIAIGVHISPYEKGNIFNADPLRERKLLMHRGEINRLFGKVKEKGFSLIPLSLYFSGQYVKMELALARGKKLYDKRDTLAEKAERRDTERSIKEVLKNA